jgi:hypothetical protein
MSIKNPYIGYDFVEPEIHAFNEGVKAANEDWIEWIEKMFTIQYSNGEIQRFPHIVITNSEWQARKKEINQ